MPTTNQTVKEKQNLSKEVIEVIRTAQEVTQKFADEVHGELNDEIYSLAALLHQARIQAEHISKKIQ